MKTLYVNLWASPSCGKSTLAAALFSDLKQGGVCAELITESAKDLAWEGRNIATQVEQIRVTSEQVIREERLAGKVDVAITDSPALLGAFYEELYMPEPVLRQFLIDVRARRERAGHTTVDLLLPRREFYDTRGRYQTKEQAVEVHTKLVDWLGAVGIQTQCLQAASLQDAKAVLFNPTLSPSGAFLSWRKCG